jgi:serine/threonine protein kinase
MATFEKQRPPGGVPADLLPVILSSGVLTGRQFADVKAKVLAGDYPVDSLALAERLVKERILTAYQVNRFLKNKPHGLAVGRYVILDRLGSGSMGRVYKAHHKMMDRQVALKIIAPNVVSNERVIARFYREMKLVGRLDHPNVVRAYDADQISQVLYIVMEYVSGQSLAQRLRSGPIPAPEMIDYATQAALGLAHAHEQGIVHRDIKPSNLLLRSDRRLKVLDLGLGVLMEADDASSFATADGIAVGTIDYMSPEQACGKDVDGRSDLFGLGCSMYHLITGRLPFPGETPIDRLGKRISGRPTPIADVRADLPRGLAQVMDRLLAHKPGDRYQSADEAAEALQTLARPRSTAATPARAASKEPSPPRPEPTPPPAQVLPVPAPPPRYPAWFKPLAGLAERQPMGALVSILGVAAALIGTGFALARLLR